MADAKGLLCHNDDRGLCVVCGRAGGWPCSTCGVDFYCRKAHQQQDLPRHRLGCGALELRQDEELGLHVVFTKDVPAGTVVLKERPLVTVVPPWAPVEYPWCVGCLDDFCLKTGDGWHLVKVCRRCGWPICSDDCSGDAKHADECREFQRAGFKLTKESRLKAGELLWTALAALRTHLASQKHQRLLDLQSCHISPLPSPRLVPKANARLRLGVLDANNWRSLRGASERQERDWPAAAQWLREEAGISWIAERELVRAAGVNDINALHMSPLNGHSNAKNASFLFAAMSMVEHQCRPTGMLMASDEDPSSDSMEHVIVVGQDVKAGDHLSLDYLEAPFQDGAMRRAMLRRGWSFVCHCPVCEDPTSFGNHLGSVYCPKCTRLGQKKLMVADVAHWDGSEDAEFRCEGCGQSSEVPRLLAENDLLVGYKSTHATACFEVFNPALKAMSWPRGPLHPNHRLVLNSEFAAWIRFSGDILVGGKRHSPADLERNLEKVRRLINVLEVMKPGMSHHGWVLHLYEYIMIQEQVDALPTPPRSISRVSRDLLERMTGLFIRLKAAVEAIRLYHVGPHQIKSFNQMIKPAEEALRVLPRLLNM